MSLSSYWDNSTSAGALAKGQGKGFIFVDGIHVFSRFGNLNAWCITNIGLISNTTYTTLTQTHTHRHIDTHTHTELKIAPNWQCLPNNVVFHHSITFQEKEQCWRNVRGEIRESVGLFSADSSRCQNASQIIPLQGNWIPQDWGYLFLYFQDEARIWNFPPNSDHETAINSSGAVLHNRRWRLRSHQAIVQLWSEKLGSHMIQED